jgi:hypothetical protein
LLLLLLLLLFFFFHYNGGVFSLFGLEIHLSHEFIYFDDNS